jgi:hypothetical protein
MLRSRIRQRGRSQSAPFPSNLLKWSEDFTQDTWVKLASTVTVSSTPSPSGGAANQIKMTAGNNAFPLYGTQTQVQIGSAYTASVFCRHVNAQWLWIRGDGTIDGAATVWAAFDIQNGALGNKLSSVIDSTITVLDDGWYRVSLTWVVNLALADANVVFKIGDSATPTTDPVPHTGEEKIDLWGAQLNPGLTALPYKPTTSLSD